MRGQAYDAAQTMSGHLSGRQNRVKELKKRHMYTVVHTIALGEIGSDVIDG